MIQIKHISTALALLVTMGVAHANSLPAEDTVQFMGDSAMAEVQGAKIQGVNDPLALQKFISDVNVTIYKYFKLSFSDRGPANAYLNRLYGSNAQYSKEQAAVDAVNRYYNSLDVVKDSAYWKNFVARNKNSTDLSTQSQVFIANRLIASMSKELDRVSTARNSTIDALKRRY